MAGKIRLTALFTAFLCLILCGCAKSGGTEGASPSVPTTLAAEDADFDFTKTADNMCGDKLYWSVAGDTLLIAGEGDMDDYDLTDRTPPWRAYFDDDPEEARIRRIKLQNGVTSVGDYAFRGLEGLKAVALSDTLKRIGDYAFPQEFFPERVDLPASVTEIGEDALTYSPIFVDPANRFYASDAYGVLYNKEMTRLLQFPPQARITTYTAPDTLTELTGLIRNEYLEELVLPESLTSLPAGAVNACVDLRRAVLPQGLQTLPEGMFSDCRALKEVLLPPTLTAVGARAFEYCAALESLTLPSTLKSIGENAFEGCCALTLTYDGSAYDWNRIPGSAGVTANVNVTFTDAAEYMEKGRAGFVYAVGGVELNETYDGTGEALKRLSYGDAVTVIALREDRACVEVSGGARGWCAAYDLRLEYDWVGEKEGVRAYVILFGQKEAAVYAGPGEGAAQTDSLPVYTEVYITSQSGDYAYVTYNDGKAAGCLRRENVWPYQMGKLNVTQTVTNTLRPQTDRHIDEIVDAARPAKSYTELPDDSIEAFMTQAAASAMKVTNPGGVGTRSLVAEWYTEGYNYPYEYSYVNLQGYGTLEALAADLLSYYAPAAVKRLMKGNFVELDGELFVLLPGIGDGPYTEHVFTVTDRTQDEILLEVHFAQYYNGAPGSAPDNAYDRSYRLIRGNDGFVLDRVYDIWGTDYTD